MDYVRYAIKFDITSANPKQIARLLSHSEKRIWWMTYEPTEYYDEFRFARLFDSEKSANRELRKTRFRMYGSIITVTCTI